MFTETKIESILKEADVGRPVNEIWRKYGISSATYHKWTAKHGGLEASDVKWLKELERENGHLKLAWFAKRLIQLWHIQAGQAGSEPVHRSL